MHYTFYPNATTTSCITHLRLYHTKPSLIIGDDIPAIVIEFALEKSIPVVWDWGGLCDTIDPARLENAVMAYRTIKRRGRGRMIAINWVNGCDISYQVCDYSATDSS